MRSGNAFKDCRLRFVNNTQEPLRIFWVNYSGGFSSYIYAADWQAMPRPAAGISLMSMLQEMSKNMPASSQAASTFKANILQPLAPCSTSPA